MLIHLNKEIETMSKDFILDKEESFCQCGIYRKAKRHGINHAFLKYLKCMNRFINFLATCKLFLQKKIERTQNEHEF